MAKDGKKYGSVEELYASDEYKEKGVLGREKLRAEHFPECSPLSGQSGQRALVGRDKELVTAPAGASDYVGPKDGLAGPNVEPRP